ncbi:MAG: ABC transporter permease [Verrucomicrobiae bacterium]|nr:ABC transporter permease [Verrucomicrobiae bacterium]
MFRTIGEIMVLGGRTASALPQTWRQRRKVAEQLFEIGNASLFMACMLSLFIGGVLALQSGPRLAERGISSMLGGLVGLSMAEELAPVMMSILIAGRVGSAMAAEIGSMRVYQEIDALRTMNINPIHYLVLPRLVAITVGLPMLVVFSMLVGWTGGALVAMGNPAIGISGAEYFNNLGETVERFDIAKGLIKSVVFSVAVGLVSCNQGLRTSGGPRGIGKAVTQAVVQSIVLILMLDYALTRTLLIFD